MSATALHLAISRGQQDVIWALAVDLAMKLYPDWPRDEMGISLVRAESLATMKEREVDVEDCVSVIAMLRQVISNSHHPMIYC